MFLRVTRDLKENHNHSNTKLERAENAASYEELQAEMSSSGNSRKLSNRGIQWRKETRAEAVEINLPKLTASTTMLLQVMQRQRRKRVFVTSSQLNGYAVILFYRHFESIAQVLHKSVMEPWILRCIPSIHHPLPTQDEPRWGEGQQGVPDMRLLAPPTMFPDLPGGIRRKS